VRESLRGKLTYANVVSTLCLFLLLGGGAAYAGSQLGKNSVGGKQLKRGAVTAAKIKNGAVTTAKIKKGAVSGAKINLKSLGTVPSAQTANALAPAEAWHEVGAPGEPTFLNGWKNAASEPIGQETVAFYKDQTGVVHLKGVADTGTEGAPIFALPPGFRPAAGRLLNPAAACSACSTTGDVRPLTIFGSGFSASTNGTVSMNGAAVVYLDGVSFRAES
jgi:hypothetical protein